MDLQEQTEHLLNELIAGLEKAKLAQKKLATGIHSKKMDELRNAIIMAKQAAGEIRSRELNMVKILEEKGTK